MELFTINSEIDRKFNQEYVLKSLNSYNLQHILMQHNKNMLMIKAMELELIGRSKMNKSELVEALPRVIIDTVKLEETMILLDLDEYEFIQKLISLDSLNTRKYMPIKFRFSINRGVLYAELQQNSYQYFIPPEVKQSLAMLDWEHIKTIRHHQHPIVRYINAAVNLYGVCTFDLIANLYNSHHNNPITIQEIKQIIQIHTKKEQSFYILNQYVTSTYFEEDNFNELIELLKRVENKPYYIPNKSEFIRYADSNYYEITPQLLNLKHFIIKELAQTKEVALNIMEDIQLLCSMEEPLQRIVDEVTGRGIEIESLDQLQKITELVVEVYNNTRLWSNCGHTPVELRPLRANFPHVGNQVVHTIKIGRNDPCSCGSGKKYKRCCGNK